MAATYPSASGMTRKGKKRCLEQEVPVKVALPIPVMSNGRLR